MGRAERKRWADNDQARELLKEAERRPLTEEQIEDLRIRYTGYGGLSTWNTDQHFTPPVVCRFVIDLLGIMDKDVLEPSCGSGAFIQELPAACRVTGIELMLETARVAKLCNPQARIIEGNALEMLAEVEGRFDWVIGNPPFDRMPKRAAPTGFAIGPLSDRLEWYFVELAYRALKPGGLLALVVPDGILGNARDKECRKWFLNHSWLRAVISLPTETFGFSGTSCKTSVLVIQKPLLGYHLPQDRYQIFMAMCEQIGWDSRRRETGKCDLKEISRQAWETFGGMDAVYLAQPLVQPNTQSLELELPGETVSLPGQQLSLF